MNTNDIAKEAITLLGNYLSLLLIGGGGGAAVAFLIFRTLGSKWLESKFSKSLENHKAELTRDLEQHRYQINSLFNRIIKIHEKEIDILPTAWTKLQDTLSNVANLTHPMQTYPRLDDKNEMELDELLRRTKFEFSTQLKIKNASDKNKAFQDARKWHLLNEANRTLIDFHRYLQYNRIFMSADLFALFKKVDDVLKSSLDASEFGMQYEEHKYTIEAYEKLEKDAVPVVNEIEKAIQHRLHHSEAI